MQEAQKIMAYVYKFTNADNEIIYIGSITGSTTVYGRMKSHGTKPSGDLQKYLETCGVFYITAPTNIDALHMEKHLIAHHQPKYNKREKWQEPKSKWFTPTVEIDDLEWEYYDDGDTTKMWILETARRRKEK